MDHEYSLMFGALLCVGIAYWAILTFTPRGILFNSLPAFQPFSTAIGVGAVIAGVWAYGSVDAMQLFGFFVAAGGMFILRGCWRIANHFVALDRRARLENAYRE